MERHELNALKSDGRAMPGHYSDAVQVGELLFLSGCIPIDASGSVVNGGIAAQARQVFLNIGDVLAAAGAAPEDVVKVTIYLTDVRDRPAFNEARTAFFGEARPASTLVEVGALALPGAAIEVEAIARMPSGASGKGRRL